MMSLQKKKIIYAGALIVVIGIGSVFLRLRMIPRQKTIDVPFTSQAPAGDWSEPWKNACEETSVYMVSSFYENDPIQRDAAILRIKEILQVKKETFKVSKDESLETIAGLIEALELPWSARLVIDPTQDDLKQELAANNPIIVPVFAPALWGAGFVGDGPDYHVLVLIGYDDTTGEFIVNDPGTAHGQGLRFPYEKFMAAIHDLDQKNYQAGRKAVLFTSQPLWKEWLG